MGERLLSVEHMSMEFYNGKKACTGNTRCFISCG